MMADIYIGTSGWSYAWNLGHSLDWYIAESKLNAIELNMSFYRYPYPTMIKSWAKKGRDLAWIIKTHRSITHFKKLSIDSYPLFEKFTKLFQELEPAIHYYLLQLPPSYSSLEKLENFINRFGCEKLAVEFRNSSMFSDEIKQWGEKQGILLVSIDAPEMPIKIMSTTKIYERIHGRSSWYSHDYSIKELKEIKMRIIKQNPKSIYIFFNNDHTMLQNARLMASIWYK